jgi:hypothetical protein
VITTAADETTRRARYRRERDLVANATSDYLLSLLYADDDIRRVAARDELVRRQDTAGT